MVVVTFTDAETKYRSFSSDHLLATLPNALYSFDPSFPIHGCAGRSELVLLEILVFYHLQLLPICNRKSGKRLFEKKLGELMLEFTTVTLEAKGRYKSQMLYASLDEMLMNKRSSSLLLYFNRILS